MGLINFFSLFEEKCGQSQEEIIFAQIRRSGKIEAAVWIQPSAKFVVNIFYPQLCWKDENKEKEAGNGRFLKKERAAWIKFQQNNIFYFCKFSF